MSKCIICASIFQEDIDKMISSGANDQYIKGWSKERQLNLSLKVIQTHKVKHLQYVEKDKVKLSEFEPVHLTLGEVEDMIQVEYGELLSYFANNKIKVDHQKPYDVIDIMRHLITQLSEKVKNLNDRLEQISPKSEKQALANLKEQKLKAQTRLLTAVANIKQVQLKQALGELVANKKLEEQWSYSLVGFKAKLESIPNKVALELSAISDASNVHNLLNKLITESLEELENGSRQAV